MFERVKNYPIWTLQLDSHPTLIIIDPMNAMAVWGTLEHMKTHPPEPYQVVVSGLEIYPADPTLESRYGGNCTPTLFNLHNYSFLIDRQVMTFTVISLPKNLSLSILASFVQGVIVMVNTADDNWEKQFETIWEQCKEIPGLQPLIIYSDQRVAELKIMDQIRRKASSMKMGTLTQELLQAFYGTLGRLCKRNKEQMQGVAVLKKLEQKVEQTVAQATGEGDDKKKKRCQIM